MTYTPWLGRNIGFEIELNKVRTNGRSLVSASLKTAVARALADVGAPPSYLNDEPVGWYRSNGETWDVKTDSTSGWEVASRAIQLNAEGANEELERVCHRLGSLMPQVDRSCGLHMHIETRDLTWPQVQNLVWLWARYEPYWFSLVPGWRRARSYCAPICTYSLDGTPCIDWSATVVPIITGYRDDARPEFWPRASLNLRPWWHSGRVEVRLHHGSINYQEMREWAMLMLALVERAKTTGGAPIEPYQPRRRIRAIDTAYIGAVLGLDAAPISRDLLQWIEGRRLAYNPPVRDMSVDPLGHIRQLSGRRGSRTRTIDVDVDTRPVADFCMDFQRESETVLRVPGNIEAENIDAYDRMAQLLGETNRTARGRRRRSR